MKCDEVNLWWVAVISVKSMLVGTELVKNNKNNKNGKNEKKNELLFWNRSHDSLELLAVTDRWSNSTCNCQARFCNWRRSIRAVCSLVNWSTKRRLYSGPRLHTSLGQLAVSVNPISWLVTGWLNEKPESRPDVLVEMPAFPRQSLKPGKRLLVYGRREIGRERICPVIQQIPYDFW